MKINRITTVATYSILTLAGAAGFLLPFQLPGAGASPAPADEDVIRLTGTIRDFQSTEGDFGVDSVSQLGQYAHNVSETLGPDGVPTFTGGGSQVGAQWLDKDGNPIMPYATAASDPGLPGGHFDVDVYDKATTAEKYHEHEFDDKFDVTYIDVAKDTKLLWKTIIPSTYPRDLRLEFVNTINSGGGSFKFQAGGPLISGKTADGFSTTFSPSNLTELRVNFVTLDKLRGTEPSISQGNVATRDMAFAIRMYDAVTNALKYEIAVYHHVQKSSKGGTSGGGGLVAAPTVDSCGNPINDTLGAYTFAGNGAITDSASFATWFDDEMGVNLSRNHTITLRRNSEGIYEYYTTDFFPIDGALFGNEGADHNSLFTYTISTTFVYHACTGQFFEFQGNDDAWVFINGKLVLDLGGAKTTSRQYIDLDRLGLVDGQEYPLDFFYAHRRETPTSLFHMRTNLGLAGDSGGAVTAGFD